MTNVIFDLSNIAYRSMFIVSGYSSSYTFDSQSEIDQLMRKLAMDIAYITRLMNPSRVILALDSRSWRKGIHIEENEGYKANRVKAEHINWENVFNALSEFSQIAESQGMIVTKIEKAEADDIIAMWTNELLFNQKQHVIIVSSDEDVRQLVKFNPYDAPNKKIAFSTVFNPYSAGKSGKKLFYSDHFLKWLEEDETNDIWNLSTIDVDKQDFKRIRSGEKVTMEYVDGTLIQTKKIFCGDDGDNVPAIFSWMTKNKKGEDEIKRITPSKFEKIYEMIKASPSERFIDYETLSERKADILKAIIEVTKETPPFKIDDRLRRQIRLIVLSPDVFPPEIVSEFNNKLKENLSKPKVNYSSINMQSLLNGTRYVREKKGIEASIFRDLDKRKAKSLF